MESRFSLFFLINNDTICDIINQGGEKMAVLFFATTVICAVGWIKNKISVLTAAALLEKKNIHPTKEELNECSRFVIQHLFK